jgi:ABC-type molybdate transport system permease subunit
LPIGAWAYYGAYLDGVLTTPVALWSIVLGALIMAFPLALYRLKIALGQV